MLGNQPTDWVNTWSNDAATIEIELLADGVTLNAKGHATWQGNLSPYAERFGEFEYSAIPQGNTLTLGLDNEGKDCQVQLLLMGKMLVASDNSKCGAINVSFTGFYEQ